MAEGNGNGESLETPQVVMQIALFKDGRVAVNGPIYDKELCYNMLWKAIDAIRNFKKEEPNILVPKLRM